jgi:2-polyprenyl-3-methyl-5-hydroxy-6-metoxy-1,4-benzoquinol methylase
MNDDNNKEDLSVSKQFYDEFWSDRTDIPRETIKGTEIGDRRIEVLKIVRKLKPKRILEVGCGIGFLSYELSLISPTVATDLSDGAKDVWKLLEEESKNLQFRVGDFASLDFVGEHFDVIVASEVIEHIPYSNQYNFLKKMYDLLKLGGSCILTTPNATYVLPRIAFEAQQPIEDQLDKKGLYKLVSSIGFEISDHKLFHPVLFTRDNRIYWFLKMLHLLRLLYKPLIYPIQARFFSESVSKYQIIVGRKPVI